MDDFIITDQDAVKCLDYIRDHADEYAIAKSHFNYLDRFRKTKRALIIRDYELECVGKKKLTDKERENYALRHPEYVEILDGIKDAEHNKIKLEWLLIGAQEKIKVYQTICKNYREATS